MKKQSGEPELFSPSIVSVEPPKQKFVIRASDLDPYMCLSESQARELDLVHSDLETRSVSDTSEVPPAERVRIRGQITREADHGVNRQWV